MWSTRDPFETLSQNESVLRVERDEESKLSGQAETAAFPASPVLTLGTLLTVPP